MGRPSKCTEECRLDVLSTVPDKDLVPLDVVRQAAPQSRRLRWNVETFVPSRAIATWVDNVSASA